MPTFCDIYLGACRKFFLFIFYASMENLRKYFKQIGKILKKYKKMRNSLKFIKSRPLIEGLRVNFAFQRPF